MAFSERLQRILIARDELAQDFFGGWTPTDLALFEKYHFPLAAEPGYITDYFGLKTETGFVPWAARLDGTTSAEPPIPDDGVRAEAIEYFALLDALDQSIGNAFTIVELGASYAPWASIAGVLAKRVGKSFIARTVEASSFFCGMIPRMFAANGLANQTGDPKVEMMVIYGAVGVRVGSIFFPRVRSAWENGGRMVESAPDVDYVGRSVEHEEVPVKTLREIFDGLTVIDFMHCDIQGSEHEVLVHGAPEITRKVRRMFVGTHSRKIEGDLIECYHKHGWSLRRERPVTFEHVTGGSSVVGMTTKDGGQYWVNNLTEGTKVAP